MIYTFAIILGYARRPVGATAMAVVGTALLVGAWPALRTLDEHLQGTRSRHLARVLTNLVGVTATLLVLSAFVGQMLAGVWTFNVSVGPVLLLSAVLYGAFVLLRKSLPSWRAVWANRGWRVPRR